MEAKPRPPYSADTPPMVPWDGYRVFPGLRARLDVLVVYGTTTWLLTFKVNWTEGPETPEPVSSHEIQRFRADYLVRSNPLRTTISRPKVYTAVCASHAGISVAMVCCTTRVDSRIPQDSPGSLRTSHDSLVWSARDEGATYVRAHPTLQVRG